MYQQKALKLSRKGHNLTVTFALEDITIIKIDCVFVKLASGATRDKDKLKLKCQLFTALGTMRFWMVRKTVLEYVDDVDKIEMG